MINKQFCVPLLLIKVVQIVLVTSLLCPGKYQIPLDANHYDIVTRNISKLEYKLITRNPIRGTVENNGQTIIIKLDYKTNAIPTILKGPFGDEEYRFELIYLYWLNETKSEEYGEGSILPIELHIVFANIRYADYETASAKNLGIAVLVFKHTLMESISDSGFYSTLENVRHPGDKYELDTSESHPLNTIYTSLTYEYNAYIGKQVFPRVETEVCGADVIWLEFLYSAEMMLNEMQYFRDLLSFDDIPLMSKTGFTIPPNTTIYQSFDSYIYEENDWKLEPFEGFGFIFDSGNQVKNTKLIVILSLVRFLMEWTSLKCLQ